MSGSRVFVSHSHQDTVYCRDFVAAVRAQGYAVWYDEHNLVWGALRPTIEREMPQCQHFIAILSPAAVASDWVNAEIDAGLVLLHQGALRTFTFVAAHECDVPLLLRRWKRIEGPNGAPVSAPNAAQRAAAIFAAEDTSPSGSAPPYIPPSPQSTLPDRPGPAPAPATATPAHHLTPMSLYT
ncbi:MAG: toll/interleukin-1 receptor domain-containing protein, partial [Ktedonobacterales bacterium]